MLFVTVFLSAACEPELMPTFPHHRNKRGGSVTENQSKRSKVWPLRCVLHSEGTSCMLRYCTRYSSGLQTGDTVYINTSLGSFEQMLLLLYKDKKYIYNLNVTWFISIKMSPLMCWLWAYDLSDLSWFIKSYKLLKILMGCCPTEKAIIRSTPPVIGSDIYRFDGNVMKHDVCVNESSWEN